MIKIILGLALLASLGLSETPKQLQKRLFVKSKNVYEFDLDKEYCVRISDKQRKEIIESWSLMRQAGLQTYFLNMDTGNNTEGNGKYVFFQGLKRFSAYVVNNEEWCNKLFKRKNIVYFNDSINQQYGYDSGLIGFTEYMKVEKSDYSTITDKDLLYTNTDSDKCRKTTGDLLSLKNSLKGLPFRDYRKKYGVLHFQVSDIGSVINSVSTPKFIP